jgi:pyruvate,water dikinase
MGIWRPIGGVAGGGEWVGHDPSERFPVYTRGNAGEVYPEVFTPLSFSVAAGAGEQAMRNVMVGSGLIRPHELDDLPLTTAVGAGVFGGYAYLNLSIQRLASARLPGGKATDADVNYLGVGDPPPHEPLPGERNLRATLAGCRYVWRLLQTTSLPSLAADQQRVDRYLAALPDPATATDDELRHSVDDLVPLFAGLYEEHLRISFGAGFAVAVLSAMCDKGLGDPLLAVQLLGGLGEVDSAAPSRAMWELSRRVLASPELTVAFDEGIDALAPRLDANAEGPLANFRAAFRRFLAEHGARGPNEWDTAFDTWETDPRLALTLIDRMRGADESHDPSRQQERLAAEAAAVEADCLARLARPARPLFRRALRAARLFSRGRERSKTTVVRAIHGARLQTQELARRLAERSGGERSDLWLVLEDELDAYVADPASFAPVIAERRAQLALLAEREPPFFFSGQQPPLEEWALRDTPVDGATAGEVLSGLPGCPGVARGRARVVTDPADPRGLTAGDVLIAPLTDPSWTPLFVPAEAVVVDVGAIMSHAIIVSRELGIPCVVSVTDATKRIPDGALVEVDGTSGTVTIVELSAD